MKLVTVAVLGLAVMTGCSGPQKPAAEAEKKQPKPTEAITGRSAFQKLYTSARAWAADAKPFRLESQPIKDVAGQDGKAAIWRGSFASPAKRSVKPYVWSGTDAEGAPDRGVNPGSEDTFNPNNASTSPFEIAFLKTDSDQAFAEAQKHGGEKIIKKTPDQAVMYVLDWNPRENQLTWHVIYGTNRQSADLRVAVDASTGKFLRVER